MQTINCVQVLLQENNLMIKRLFYASRRVLQMLLSSLLGGLVVIVIIAVISLNNRPDLHVWHTTILEHEFVADSDLDDFQAYLELEDRLFDELDSEIYQKIEPEDQREINRYHRGSLADPRRWERNWNRSFVLQHAEPRAGVLLLHGMSDSPYSMRQIGLTANLQGAWVIGLRIPGHGQAPSGLLRVEWEDMAAAVRLAMSELRDRTGDHPIYIGG
jgi:hypothetical protein